MRQYFELAIVAGLLAIMLYLMVAHLFERRYNKPSWRVVVLLAVVATGLASVIDRLLGWL